MRKTCFEKIIKVKGSLRTVEGVVIATLNYDSKLISGTHAGTHDDFTRTIPVHKVEAFIDGDSWKIVPKIESENQILAASKNLINEFTKHLEYMANNNPEKTFTEKMKELFQDNK